MDRAYLPIFDAALDSPWREGATDWAEWTSTDDLPDAFFTGLLAVAAAIGTQAQYLLGVMKAESDIRSDAVNPHGHATGLIQFMPDTQQRLGLVPPAGRPSAGSRRSSSCPSSSAISNPMPAMA